MPVAGALRRRQRHLGDRYAPALPADDEIVEQHPGRVRGRVAELEAVDDQGGEELAQELQQGDAYSFRHALVQEVLRDDLLPGERSALHAAYARARHARIDLHADAQPPPPEPAPSPARQLGLTPREQEVLALVADGRTNRQIAQALFVTDKTASVHVSRILAKLGVTNRAEAGAVAHRLPLTSS